jgi:hypothetical protein
LRHRNAALETLSYQLPLGAPFKPSFGLSGLREDLQTPWQIGSLGPEWKANQPYGPVIIAGPGEDRSSLLAQFGMIAEKTPE